MTGRKMTTGIWLLIAICQLCFCAQLFSGYEQLNFLELETGYRWDKISNRVVVYGKRSDAHASTQSANAVNTYQLGCNAQYTLCPWIAKISYHHGWVLSGDYDEASFHGSLNGHTDDASAGAGYLFCPRECIFLIPFAGWSYDRLMFNGRHVKTPLNGEVIDVGNIEFNSRLAGPWIGADVVFEPSPRYQITFTYELHYSYWRGSRHLWDGELGNQFGVTTGFSSRRHHSNIWGNLFEINGSYAINDCWQIGLSCKYQNRKSNGNGKINRSRVHLPHNKERHHSHEESHHSHSSSHHSSSHESHHSHHHHSHDSYESYSYSSYERHEEYEYEKHHTSFHYPHQRVEDFEWQAFSAMIFIGYIL